MPSIRNVPRTLAAMFASSLVLGGAVGAASARNLSSSTQNIRVTWSMVEFGVAGTGVRCHLTLEGSFHARTIAKVARSLIGAITRAIINEGFCTNGRARAKSLPWHITYEAFTGTLPNIASVRLLLSRFRFEIIIAGLCTADYGTETDNVTGQADREAGGGLVGLAIVAGRNTVNRVSGSFFCPASATMIGTGSITALASTNRVTITLI